jgi:hypothetical protein
MSQCTQPFPPHLSPVEISEFVVRDEEHMWISWEFIGTFMAIDIGILPATMGILMGITLWQFIIATENGP